MFRVQSCAVMLERWNDDKMDALADKVDGIEVELRELRREVREDIRELRGEMKDLRQEMKDGFERMGQTMVQGAFGLAGTMILGFAALVATQL